MKGSAKIQMEINLESQALDEDMYYYGYSKEEVLSSPSDLLGEFRASCSKLMANHEIKNTWEHAVFFSDKYICTGLLQT